MATLLKKLTMGHECMHLADMHDQDTVCLYNACRLTLYLEYSKINAHVKCKAT